MKEQILHDYFQSILGTAEHCQVTINWSELHLPVLHENMLDAPFGEDEIKQAIEDLPSEKVPGRMVLQEPFIEHVGGIMKNIVGAAL
jgi:hypothetical protein